MQPGVQTYFHKENTGTIEVCSAVLGYVSILKNKGAPAVERSCSTELHKVCICNTREEARLGLLHN